jgi:hypothetical protein
MNNSTYNVKEYFTEATLKPENSTNYIYIIIGKLDNKFYVGKRRRSEFDESYYGSGSIIEAYIKKYGKQSVERYVLEWCTDENVNDCEDKWIKKLKASKIEYPEFGGMNLLIGGYGGFVKDIYGDKNPAKDPEVKAKISKKTCGANNASNKYIYTLSNGEDFFSYFTPDEKKNITTMFYTKKKDIITYKGTVVERKLRNDLTEEVLTRKKSDEFMKKISGKRSDEVRSNMSKGSSRTSIYNYKMSNGQDYSTFFDSDDKLAISKLFGKEMICRYRGYVIERFLKDGCSNEKPCSEDTKQKISELNRKYEYVLNNGEDYDFYFSIPEKKLIRIKFSNHPELDEVEFSGVKIKRVL